MKHEPINLLNVQQLHEYGLVQCDQHRRDRNAQREKELHDARIHLVLRFTPFIWLEDENLEPVTLMETVAVRLMEAAQEERERRKELQAA